MLTIKMKIPTSMIFFHVKVQKFSLPQSYQTEKNCQGRKLHSDIVMQNSHLTNSTCTNTVCHPFSLVNKSTFIIQLSMSV